MAQLGSVVVVGEWRVEKEPFGPATFNGSMLSELVRLCVPVGFEGRLRIRVEAESLEPVNLHYEVPRGLSVEGEKPDETRDESSSVSS